MINLVGDEEQILDEEQAVMDDQEDKVAEITERLHQLLPESKVASLAANSVGHSNHLQKGLNHLKGLRVQSRTRLKA